MIVLDENINEGQQHLLRAWRIRFRQIGSDVSQTGVSDRDIVRVLHGLRSSTFFTRDRAFYARSLCHPRYCLVYLRVEPQEAASFIRRLLKHSEFSTQAKRRGRVTQVAPNGIRYWQLNRPAESHCAWESKGE
jgi:hypothetical protein